MKALVLSAGSGTRLRPLTYSMPKQLVPLANKPVLLYCLENLAEIGVKDVGIVVGPNGGEIRRTVGDGGRLGLNVTYVPQEAALGLAHCVLIARDFLADDDFVMYLADNVFAAGLGDAATAFHARRPDAQVVVTAVPDPAAFGVAVLDEAARVTGLVEKPDRFVSDLAVTGAYFLTPAIHAAVRRLRPSRRGELEITDALQLLVSDGADVRAVRYRGYWKDTGRIEDVLECHRVLVERIVPRILGHVDEASRLSGRVVVEPGARIIRSHIEGPAIIGANAQVTDSYVGPYTALGADCVLQHAGVDSSIILDRVSVRGVRDISGSFIGRSSYIAAAAEVSRHRLVIGDDTRVEVLR
ncbi:glucose-1-phosphate thymidylyltransferase [Dactylosporangium sp. CA-092794]|uniref:glucose-1-phosphate thymidylyltransferase n=1 Tax=Dactylosporangium sp. CA-092794 TaxID=3239929 RepID=UPI003D8C7DCF